MEGDIAVIEPHVEVRWAWLILPAALNLLAAVFLVSTILGTRAQKAPLWKSSVIAPRFHQLECPSLLLISDPKTLGEMDEQAKKVNVKLKTSDNDGRLLLGS